VCSHKGRQVHKEKIYSAIFEPAASGQAGFVLLGLDPKLDSAAHSGKGF
jgi:hypothetical protein